MKILKLLTILTLLFTALSTYSQNSKDQDIMKDAEQAKQKLLKKDAGLKMFFDNSSGYVIFPNVGKGGLIIGGASGNGVVYENGSAIGMADLKKIDVGLQVGGKALIEVIFFETEDALNEFKTDDFSLSSEISAIAVESGVSKNASYDNEVVVFTMPKAGLMAEISVGGQHFGFEPFK